MKTRSAIIWFRKDLRLEDNPALSEAIAAKLPIIPLFIWAPGEEGLWAPGSASKWWLHYSLESLDRELRGKGSKLIIRSGKNSQEALEKVIHESGAEMVFWNRCYEPAVIARDARIKSALRNQGLECRSFNGHLLFEPWEVSNKQKQPFRVFTPFWNTCLKENGPPKPLGKPGYIPFAHQNLSSLTINDLGLLPKNPWDAGLKASWQPGSDPAKKHLKDFIKDSILRYHLKKDRPSEPGTSHLSPYLHFGEISPRIIWHKVLEKYDFAEPGVECFLRQLGWREFAHHLLYHYPFTPEQPMRKEFAKFPWDYNDAALKAWQKGRTGYPLVDAGMRQLWTSGWMHNRVRMLAGSFLVKDLLIPWQEGAKWFWDTLVDADLANNTLGWQWVGGCGADAAPYFRIFNPVAQGEKFDPDGSYVRRWLPELGSVPKEWIHRPWEAPGLQLREWNVQLGKTYPYPIVDHSLARGKALAAFQTIK